LIPIRLASLDQVKAGAYGIREPAGDETIEPAELGLVVVPAVAFDRRGQRLGRGGGYYDRFLELLSPGAVTCGVTFARYVLDRVPTEPHDKPVQIIVTDSDVIRPKSDEPRC
jgi:5-formyltetrahydrofolate cyclo-ligase